MPDYKTPGVYINEITHFPTSIASVETAIPAFVGYTEKMGDALFTAKRITSIIEFEQYFGFAFPEMVEVTLNNAIVLGDLPEIKADLPNQSPYILQYQISMFYANGGGPCYVIPVGTYDSAFTINKTPLLQGLNACKAIDEISLLIVPEIVNLTEDEDIKELHDAMLSQCSLLQDRFAIFDVPQKSESKINLIAKKFRNDLVGSDNLKFGAAYIPKLQTVLSYNRVGDDSILVYDQQSIKTEVNKSGDEIKLSDFKSFNDGNLYNQIKIKISEISVPLYPSGAIAGIYSRTDSARGVWKAPANVNINMVIKPLIQMNNSDQEDLNHIQNGKSINVIRAFTGKGVLVWGARTLDGKDNEYRYISTRRFVNMVEESTAKAIQQFIFEPNDANTWYKIKTMCENFLLNLWRQGGLQGAKPEDAFAVQIGLNKTMTDLDILEGRLILEIMLAVVRPTEFLIITIKQKMQES